MSSTDSQVIVLKLLPKSYQNRYWDTNHALLNEYPPQSLNLWIWKQLFASRIGLRWSPALVACSDTKWETCHTRQKLGGHRGRGWRGTLLRGIPRRLELPEAQSGEVGALPWSLWRDQSPARKLTWASRLHNRKSGPVVLATPVWG